MDAGEYEARSAFEAGADFVTVLGVTDLATVEACLKTADRYGKTVVVDMICVADMPERIAQLGGSASRLSRSIRAWTSKPRAGRRSTT